MCLADFVGRNFAESIQPEVIALSDTVGSADPDDHFIRISVRHIFHISRISITFGAHLTCSIRMKLQAKLYAAYRQWLQQIRWGHFAASAVALWHKIELVGNHPDRTDHRILR